MREFEKGFKDRKRSNATEDYFEVLEKEEHANGEMTLKGYLNRSNEEVVEEGTKLDSESMNSAVLDLIYYELYGLDLEEEPYSKECIGKEEFFDKYNIRFMGPRFYGAVASNPFLNIEVTNYQFVIQVIVESKENLHNITYEMPVDYYINIYSDEECTNFVTRVKKRINYIPSSTSSND